MPTPRKRLVKHFNPKRGLKGYLSPGERAMIVQALLSREKVSTLATRFRCHRNTITNTMNRYRTTNSFDDKHRTGGRPILTIREKRAVYRRLRQNPEMPSAQLKA
jgi:hypothetical protein